MICLLNIALKPVYHYMCKFLNNPLPFLGSHQGFVISDFEGIDRITSPPRANITYSIEAGVSAGIDMVSLGQKYMI